jgi:hypothetical protein
MSYFVHWKHLLYEAASFTLLRPEFEPRSGHVGFVVHKVALLQVLSEYMHFL